LVDFIIEADGGSRGNPGPAAYGVVIRDGRTREVVFSAAQPIGTATNNVAEYQGLLAGLRAVIDLVGADGSNSGEGLREAGENLREAGESRGEAGSGLAKAGHGLREAGQGLREIEVRMDSKLVVEQMSGRWKIKDAKLRPLADSAREAMRGLSVSFVWVPRGENVDADALLNAALDAAT
jgi:probable phosphoglycerate mutase